MLNGHVFIVNENTLDTHLKYMFVGTSAGDRDNNISLLADMLRVKRGDLIFFYIEGFNNKKGRFFGCFKAVDETVYHFTGPNSKKPNLPIKLIYRKKIVPFKVFSKGVLEWLALDKLPTYSKELLWSLIYRKMKGKRGNTMLFPWETERLISLIENDNNGQPTNSKRFGFDKEVYEIVPASLESSDLVFTTPVNISSKDVKNSETHFQAFVLQNINLHNNDFHPNIFGKDIVWVGNEVFAGSGMQKIDIITIEKIDETTNIYRIIELKHPKSSTNVNFAPAQLEYYINWARDDIGGHILGGKKFNIKPILLSLSKTLGSIPQDVVTEIEKLNSIATNPEIYELDFTLQATKVL